MDGPTSDPLIGRQIRDLRILELLGRGGMGAVYRAEHVLLRELRAVKVIRKETFSVPNAVERFSREARIAVRLRHANLVLVHDFFIEDGDHYLVMEYVAGDSLGKRIRANGAFDAQTACELAIRCCAGLAHAHEMGIIHRDLSPENILLAPTSRGFEPRIIDFGIARAAFAQTDSEGTGTDVTLTHVGGFVGKPRYASPEQAGRLRRGEKLDARCDIYGFGLILYEMVTADLPFHSDNEIGYLSLHYSTLPERPTVLRPELDIPLSLERVILRCLEKDRENRYANAEELGRALESVLAEQRSPASVVDGASPAYLASIARPVRSDPPSSARHASPASDDTREFEDVPTRRRMAALLAGIFAVCVSLVALGWAFWSRNTSELSVQTAPSFERSAPVAAAAPESAPVATPPPPVVPAVPAEPAKSPAPTPPAPRRELAAAPSKPAAAEPQRELAASASTPAVVKPQPRSAAPGAGAEKPVIARVEPPPAAAPPTPAAIERYTMTNLHPRGNKLFSFNFLQQGLIPLCTRVRIDQQTPKVVRFTVIDTGKSYVYLRHGATLDFDANVNRYFGTNCVRDRLAELSDTDREGIRLGKALPGMTKAGVILAIGFPPEHATPSPDSNEWRYWRGKFDKLRVEFENGRVVKVVD